MEMENFQISKEEFDQFKIILEDWISKDASIAIALGETYVYHSKSTHHSHLEFGEAIHPESIAARVLKSRQKTEAIIDQSILGEPYYAIGYPIHFNKQEAALIVILPSTYSVEKREPYKFLTGRQDEDWTPVPIEQISHIESLQKRTWFYAQNDQYKTTITLKELQTKLPEYFVRIHRSYILNTYFIKRISKDLASNFVIELKNGTELPVSQSYVNNLRKALEF
ncbi:LytTR family DNA-binding domain-containing protein [Lysinibacillus sp. BW-2-10]|uniref:LytR/AlgR family response regulator transcription factor n=1 Tax=Lysinibacillus sp. BW-2-10 TaxID=2590030 RepID=UPI00117F542E|nr:LytTR family DNA-binding domain-containing protein [Lysinibacillus sp. BW-2-10]TSI08354.1 LytTR family transcriptional regulator [Lysinibacillus sp. BW-2-10]